MAALERGFNEIVRRHEAWRTTFAIVDGEPSQVIHPAPLIALPVIHLEGLPAAQREAEALRLATEDARVPFDLAQGPLLRARLVRLDETEHRLYLTLHHIIFDGVSIYDVLLPELAALTMPTLPANPRRCRSRSSNTRTTPTGSGNAWGTIFSRRTCPTGANCSPTCRCSNYRPITLAQPVQTFRGCAATDRAPRPLIDALKEMSRREGVTLYMTLISALVTMLHRYAGQDDVVIGTVTGVADRPEIEKLMGFFLNTLALRTNSQTIRASAPCFSASAARRSKRRRIKKCRLN